MSVRERGTCRGCGRVISLTKEPAEHLRMGRDYTPADVFRACGEPVPEIWLEYERSRAGVTP